MTLGRTEPTPSADIAIQARGLRIEYPKRTVFETLDMSAPAGRITAVLGRNGSGKTTLVRALATLQPYQAGSLCVLGHEVKDSAQTVRGIVGLAGQHAAVVAELTGVENLRMVARLYGLSPKEARRATAAVIDEFALSEFVDRRVATYSGGQRRRLDLAATFVNRPSALLLDEPTTGLDPHSRNSLWESIRTLPANGTSVLLTTQYLEEAQALADEVVIIDDGRVVQAGTPHQLRCTMAHTKLRLVTHEPLSDDESIALAERVLGEVSELRDNELTVTGQFDLDAAYRAVTEQGISSDIAEFSVSPPTLDDVFLSMTGSEART
ncbi:ATP-binding cassette domain-containing protein [Rhodococcus sp. NPDC080181]|uniref:ABC transporter ATP-binding protein n=1 Tax=Rhodococcus sp. NPDC080181 TaxID=3155292 RepID=UPI00344CBE97